MLSGEIAASVVRGIQGTGVVATIKHFVCNDQEHDRHAQRLGSVGASTARDLPDAVPDRSARPSQPGAYMTAYNKVNGRHASESKWLLNGILRKERGFDGAVISDWYCFL